jgi:hypothetical protein
MYENFILRDPAICDYSDRLLGEKEAAPGCPAPPQEGRRRVHPDDTRGQAPAPGGPGPARIRSPRPCAASPLHWKALHSLREGPEGYCPNFSAQVYGGKGHKNRHLLRRSRRVTCWTRRCRSGSRIKTGPASAAMATTGCAGTQPGPLLLTHGHQLPFHGAPTLKRRHLQFSRPFLQAGSRVEPAAIAWFSP